MPDTQSEHKAIIKMVMEGNKEIRAGFADVVGSINALNKAQSKRIKQDRKVQSEVWEMEDKKGMFANARFNAE